MSVDNTTTNYSIGNTAVVAVTSTRNPKTNTSNDIFTNALDNSTIDENNAGLNKNSNTTIITNIKNSAANIENNILADVLLDKSEKSKQSKNPDQNNILDKRNDKKNIETSRLDNERLDKKLLNQSEIRSDELETDYVNQLDRRKQIHNEYLNRLNKHSEQNKSTNIIHETTKNLSQTENQLQSVTTNSITNNPTESVISAPITQNNNLNNNTGQIKFLDATNYRSAVRKTLLQNDLNAEIVPSRISVTIMVLTASTHKESNRHSAGSQQTTFTIFTPTGRIEQIEYNKDQNNHQKQNEENNKNNNNNDKEKNKNKKNNIEQLQQSQSDNSYKNNSSLIDSSNNTPDIFNNSPKQTLLPKEIADMQSDNNPSKIFESNPPDIESNRQSIFDLSHLPEIIVTILSEAVKFSGQIDFNKNNQINKNTNNIDNNNIHNTIDNLDLNLNTDFSLDIGDVSWRNRLLLRIAAASRSMANRNNTFRVKLNLDDSGELFIRIRKNNGNFSVSFTATNSAVAESLINGIDTLKQSLEDDNVKLEDVMINVGQI
ncbi:MAG: flagellar hook-length control protein FliK [Planctomycetaceae bacterium]|jgi:hypothetical protein|nr:flagellar hook-length control protein FliK [Planctomycetaceae bacterium]